MFDNKNTFVSKSLCVASRTSTRFYVIFKAALVFGLHISFSSLHSIWCSGISMIRFG